MSPGGYQYIFINCWKKPIDTFDCYTYAVMYIWHKLKGYKRHKNH